MNRAEKRKKYSAGEVELIKLLATKNANEYATKCIYASTLLVLHDKFGFGSERCKRFLKEVDFQVGCIRENRLTYEDAKKTVREELDIEITDK